jgi:FMN reductase
VGGSLRTGPASRGALRAVPDGTLDAGARPTLLRVRELRLPMHSAEQPVPHPARSSAEAVCVCDVLIWSTHTWHGSVSGSFKNVLDRLILLAVRKPPYLTSKPVGPVPTAGRTEGRQAVNSTDFIARACGLRASRWSCRRQSRGAPPTPTAGRRGARRQGGSPVT